MSHVDVKYSTAESKWLVIWHGNYGSKTVNARRKRKKDALNFAERKVKQALNRGWSTGEIHVYGQNGEMQRIQEVDYK